MFDNGFDYPVLTRPDGHKCTVRLPMRVIAEMRRAFPVRRVMKGVMDDESVKKNAEILAWNKEHPDDLKNVITDVYDIKEVIIGAGAVDFDNVDEVLEAYLIVINASPEVKDGTAPKIELSALLDSDGYDFVPILEFLIEALSAGRTEKAKNP